MARQNLSANFFLKRLIQCAECGFNDPHYTQKKHKDGSPNRIPLLSLHGTVHFSNAVCSVRHVNEKQG
jgi:hypothetical protein